MNWVMTKLLCRCRQASDVLLGRDREPSSASAEELDAEFARDEMKHICTWFHLNNCEEIQRLSPYHFKSRWEGVLVDSLSSRWTDLLFSDGEEEPADELWKRLHVLFVQQWRGSPEERAAIVFSILSPGQDMLGYKPFKQYVEEIMNSLHLMLLFSESDEFSRWFGGEEALDSTCLDSLRQYILRDVKTRTWMSVDELEEWMKSDRVLRSLLGELCCLSVNLKPPARQLVPRPICPGQACSPFVDLGHIIFLSTHLHEDETNEWRLVFDKGMDRACSGTLERCVRGKGPTILLIRDDNERVFGAYVSQLWPQQQTVDGEKSSFVFTLAPEINFYQLSNESTNFRYWFFQDDSDGSGLGLGEGPEDLTIWLDEALDEGRCSPEGPALEKYELPTILPAFRARDLQVWSTRDRCACNDRQISVCSVDNEFPQASRSALKKIVRILK